MLPKSSVIIGRNRIESARIAIEELGADYLVMDDGFQHRALHRDKDIVLIDASNPLAMNMYCQEDYYVSLWRALHELILLCLQKV